MSEMKRLVFEDLQVWISIDGKELEQYGVHLDEGKREVTCWIPSEVGKEFFVNMMRTAKYKFDYNYAVYLDGERAGSRSLTRRSSNVARQRAYKRISRMEVRNYAFGLLDLTEDEVPETTSLKNLGDIKIIVQSGHIVSMGYENSAWDKIPLQDEDTSSETTRINERSKKALTHHVKFSEKCLNEAGPGYHFTPTNDIAPVTFIFKYRPMSILQANGIAPRENTSSTTNDGSNEGIIPALGQSRKRGIGEVETDDISEDVAAIERAEAKLHLELETLRKLKRSKMSSGGIAKVKGEMKPIFLPGEVIDLT